MNIILQIQSTKDFYRTQSSRTPKATILVKCQKKPTHIHSKREEKDSHRFNQNASLQYIHDSHPTPFCCFSQTQMKVENNSKNVTHTRWGCSECWKELCKTTVHNCFPSLACSKCRTALSFAHCRWVCGGGGGGGGVLWGTLCGGLQWVSHSLLRVSSLVRGETSGCRTHVLPLGHPCFDSFRVPRELQFQISNSVLFKIYSIYKHTPFLFFYIVHIHMKVKDGTANTFTNEKVP